MAFSSGTFTRLYNWVTDRNNTIKIRADRMDEEMDGFATGLSNCICRDGQSTVSANIPFNNKRITGLGDASADTDAVNRQSGDARYMRNPADLSNETAIADDDELGFYDTSAAANKAITWSAFKTEVAAETAFIPATKVTNTAAGNIVATTVQAAIDELDTEKLAKASNLSDVASAATAFGNIKQDATTAATGVLQKADQAAMEALTSGRAVTADIQHHHPGHPKAAIKWTSITTTAILWDYGISSLTDRNTGETTLNFSTAFSGDDNYAATLSVLGTTHFCVVDDAEPSVAASLAVQTLTPTPTLLDRIQYAILAGDV